MTDWTEGYVAEVDYTYGYYPELNPLRNKLAMLMAGLHFPKVVNACELGFGQGISVNVHAAATGVNWYGNDFNPAQTAFAHDLSAISGASVRLYDDSFAEFANRKDLPEFDFIGMHGIWSWISDENRAVIVDFLRKKLRVGGVLYISYNTMPGWSTFAPLRHLMNAHVTSLSGDGQGVIKKINKAMEFAEAMIATGPAFTASTPSLVGRMQKVKDMNQHYLAHEYFNRDWHPMYFNDVAKLLGAAKLSYACSARLLDHVDHVNMTQDHIKFLREISDPVFRELVRDFLKNQQFRTDYWVKGSRKLTRPEREKALAELRFVLTTPKDDVPLKLTGALGEVTLKEDLYKTVLDFMADHRPHSLAALSEFAKAKEISPLQLQEVLIILSGAGHVYLAQDEMEIRNAMGAVAKLNKILMEKALTDNETPFLASAVTGGGIGSSRFQKMFLAAHMQGIKTPNEWANFAWGQISAQGQKIVKEGKTLETPAENLAELTSQATAFEQKLLPVLRGLEIA